MRNRDATPREKWANAKCVHGLTSDLAAKRLYCDAQSCLSLVLVSYVARRRSNWKSTGLLVVHHAAIQVQLEWG